MVGPLGRVLVAGCGYVGTALADLLRQAGHEVDVWTRSAESAAQLTERGYQASVVDIAEKDQVAARAESFDAVIHCASTGGGQADLYRRVYLEGARHLLECLGPSRFLFTSSTSVYAQNNGEWVTEESLTEPAHESGRILRQTEQLVLAHAGTVARLAGIYGPGRSALLSKTLNGEAVVDPEHDRFVNQVQRDDAAAALFLMLNQEVARSQIYNVADDKPAPQSECYRWLAQRLHLPPPGVGHAAAQRKRGRSNKRVRNAKLRALGWTPKYPSFVEGMEENVLPQLGTFPP